MDVFASNDADIARKHTFCRYTTAKTLTPRCRSRSLLLMNAQTHIPLHACVLQSSINFYTYYIHPTALHVCVTCTE